jgi:hypothetical protein
MLIFGSIQSSLSYDSRWINTRTCESNFLMLVSMNIEATVSTSNFVAFLVCVNGTYCS